MIYLQKMYIVQQNGEMEWVRPSGTKPPCVGIRAVAVIGTILRRHRQPGAHQPEYVSSLFDCRKTLGGVCAAYMHLFHVPIRGHFLLSVRSLSMKKKKTIANSIMIAVIVIIAAAGILLAGRYRGWFDRDDAIQASASVMRDKGIVDLTRDGIASHLDAQIALHDADLISANRGAQATLQFDNGSLVIGEDTTVRIDRAATDDFSVTVLSGEAFLQTEKAITVHFGSQSVSIRNSTATLSVRTGSETIGILSGKATVGEQELTAGQQAAFAVNSTPAYTPLEITSLSDFFLHCAQSSAQTLCFTGEALAQVLADRQAAVSGTQESGVSPDGSPSAASEQTPSSDRTTQSPSSSADPSQSSSSGSSNTKPDDTASGKDTQETHLTCTIAIYCDTILDNMENLDAGKDIYVPGNGVILSPTTISFTDGDTVLDVLKRVCDAYGIQLEYSYTPAYDSYYIEGINHLYEFDCGNESGWMYKVNGWFPNYGCSDYTVEQGDAIVWCYTCRGLGADVGGGMG